MVRDVLEIYLVTFPHDFIEIVWIELKFELFLPCCWNCVFLVSRCLLQAI